jgi:hypothetical protein
MPGHDPPIQVSNFCRSASDGAYLSHSFADQARPSRRRQEIAVTTPPTEAPLSPPGLGGAVEGMVLTPDARHGRVELLVSGQAARLTSLAALRAFTA